MNFSGVVVRHQQSFFPDCRGKSNKRRNTDILRVHVRFACNSFIWSTIPEKKVALFTVYNFCRLHFEVIWGHLPLL